ncbi:MAG: hypothetical protein ACRDHD_05500 [Candidatus Limnocylindria bacterium]
MTRRTMTATAAASLIAMLFVASSVGSAPVCLGDESLNHGDLYVVADFVPDAAALDAAKGVAGTAGSAVVGSAIAGEAPSVGATRAAILSSGDGLLDEEPVYLVQVDFGVQTFTVGGYLDMPSVLVSASCSVVAVSADSGDYLFTFTDAIPVESQ